MTVVGVVTVPPHPHGIVSGALYATWTNLGVMWCLIKVFKTPIVAVAMILALLFIGLGSLRAQTAKSPIAKGLSAKTLSVKDFTGQFMPYRAFDKLEQNPMTVKGGTLDIRIAPGRFNIGERAVRNWIRRSANAVITYYGRFPVERVRILIVPVPGRGIKRGQAFAFRGAAIRVLLGTSSIQEDLAKDWVMVHEMVHLAWPQMNRRHAWLSEGLATYVESIARHQAGDLSEEFIWMGFQKAMHQGMPKKGDKGLDRTHTWGRTYWGGALFCMLADINIRKATKNRFGLQDALRGVLAEGGNHETRADIRFALKTGDKATGTTELIKLYDKMRKDPMKPDLVKLWRDLGVRVSGKRVRFDNDAPLAAVRQSINLPSLSNG